MYVSTLYIPDYVDKIVVARVANELLLVFVHLLKSFVICILLYFS
jgi:hypothetical protein